MRRCAFLTMLDDEGYVIDDQLAYQPLQELGVVTEAVPWNAPDIRWERYDIVVIRSPWDYHHHCDQFLAVLSEIASRCGRLENSLPLVRWNLRKTYLRDLAARGVATVPTLWRDGLAPGDLGSLLEELASDEVIVKPVIGANAEDVHRLHGHAADCGAIEACFAGRPLMAQPFARWVRDEGEFSLIYFAGEHSHTILKTPKAGDFRVQEEHGGVIRAVDAEPALAAAGRAAVAAIGEVPLYARADFVRAADSRSFWLMELELIEPALYLRMDDAAPGRFARAIGEKTGR